MLAVGGLTQLAHPISASFVAPSQDLQHTMETRPAPTSSPQAPLSRPGSAGGRRPKLTLSISTIETTPKAPPGRQAKSATLRLGPASNSPTSQNTYRNAQQIVLSPLSPRGSAPADMSSPRARAFMSPLSPLPNSAGPRHRNNNKQRLPFPLDSVNAHPLPYSQPSGVRSILRNSPHRSHGRRSSKSSPETAQSQETMSGLAARFSASSSMSSRGVKYREDLEEEIRTTRHTFSHLDLLDQLEKEEEEVWVPPTSPSQGGAKETDKEAAEAEAAELKRLNDLAAREFEQEKARLNKSTAGKPIIFTPPPRRKASNTPVAPKAGMFESPESAMPKTPGLPPRDDPRRAEFASESSSSDSE